MTASPSPETLRRGWSHIQALHAMHIIAEDLNTKHVKAEQLVMTCYVDGQRWHAISNKHGLIAAPSSDNILMAKLGNESNISGMIHGALTSQLYNHSLSDLKKWLKWGGIGRCLGVVVDRRVILPFVEQLDTTTFPWRTGMGDEIKVAVHKDISTAIAIVVDCALAGIKAVMIHQGVDQDTEIPKMEWP